MLGLIKAVTQHGDILVAHRGLFAKARDQRVPTALSIVRLADLALLVDDLAAQLPKLAFVSFFGIFAHLEARLVPSLSSPANRAASFPVCIEGSVPPESPISVRHA